VPRSSRKTVDAHTNMHARILLCLQTARYSHLIDKMGSIASSDAVIMQLSARSARALITHLPEIVLHVALEDTVCRQILRCSQSMNQHAYMQIPEQILMMCEAFCVLWYSRKEEKLQWAQAHAQR
jgi:hypothetical protein